MTLDPAAIAELRARLLPLYPVSADELDTVRETVTRLQRRFERAGLVLVPRGATSQVGAWGWIGVVPRPNGAVGFCPRDPLIGMATCPMKKG